eukprot:9606-Rhodomonas_salina.1
MKALPPTLTRAQRLMKLYASENQLVSLLKCVDAPTRTDAARHGAGNDSERAGWVTRNHRTGPQQERAYR